jgi:hypothetical protein
VARAGNLVFPRSAGKSAIQLNIRAFILNAGIIVLSVAVFSILVASGSMLLAPDARITLVLIVVAIAVSALTLLDAFTV